VRELERSTKVNLKKICGNGKAVGEDEPEFFQAEALLKKAV
jgi:hypothetical protein